MISRLRSVGTKTNQERNSFFSKPRPSKEDILNTIDGFSGNLENGMLLLIKKSNLISDWQVG